MNLLAPPSAGPIQVPISRSVLYAGSRAHEETDFEVPLFPHRHVPPRPASLPDDRLWLAALDFAEEQLRFGSASAVLDLTSTEGRSRYAGRCGPSTPRVMSSSRGVEVDGILLSWSRVVAGRSEQREAEFEVAKARDLAEAYHYLDYFGRVYGEPEVDDEKSWSPIPLIHRLAEEAIQLGGDPRLLPFHTAYMRRGIMAAAGTELEDEEAHQPGGDST